MHEIKFYSPRSGGITAMQNLKQCSKYNNKKLLDGKYLTPFTGVTNKAWNITEYKTTRLCFIAKLNFKWNKLLM